MLGDPSRVDAVLEDYRTAPIREDEKALFAFLEKVNRDSSRLRKEDLEQVKAAGWSDEALYDAITVCALFSFCNKWCDAAGVGDMPAAAYAASGERLAILGYVPPETPPDRGDPRTAGEPGHGLRPTSRSAAIPDSP